MVERIVIKKQKENFSKEEICNRIEIVYTELIKKDRYLLEVDANERSITNRLALYLKSVFPEYDVDCEYNRNGKHPKKLSGFTKKIN